MINDNSNGNGRWSAEKLADIREKLSKLIALAGSPNEHEASLAMKRAAEISAKYEIELGEISASQGAKEEMVRMTVNGLRDKCTNQDLWESHLAMGVAECFNCSVVRSPYERPWKMHFMGRKSDVLLSLHFYGFVREMINKLGSFLYPKLTDKSNYAIAMVSTVNTRLKDMYSQKEQILKESGCTSLVIRKKQDSEDFKHKEFPSLINGPTAKLLGSREAYMKGREDGANLPLNRPLKTGENYKQVQ